jgi:hypothetical protein
MVPLNILTDKRGVDKPIDIDTEIMGSCQFMVNKTHTMGHVTVQGPGERKLDGGGTPYTDRVETRVLPPDGRC